MESKLKCKDWKGINNSLIGFVIVFIGNFKVPRDNIV